MSDQVIELTPEKIITTIKNKKTGEVYETEEALKASGIPEEDIAQSLVRDLDAVLEKLNTTFQEELKQEIEARSFFLN